MNHLRGATSYHAGLAAEDIVARTYVEQGATLLAQRWCGASGEIDLIFRLTEQIVFVEVKQSKTFARAATALSPRQVQRIFNAGSEFLATQPKGQLTPCRLDLAVVDGTGTVQIMQGALSG